MYHCEPSVVDVVSGRGVDGGSGARTGRTSTPSTPDGLGIGSSVLVDEAREAFHLFLMCSIAPWVLAQLRRGVHGPVRLSGWPGGRGPTTGHRIGGTDTASGGPLLILVPYLSDPLREVITHGFGYLQFGQLTILLLWETR